MSHHINLTAYANHETTFTSQQELNNYRQSKLQKVTKNINFIRQELGNNRIDALEIASGNSKFLYALHKQGLLEKGYGIEISNSRHRFAEEWKSLLNIKNVTNIHANILEFDFDTLPKFDVVYCVDLGLQLIAPLGNKADTFILQQAYNKLKMGGKIILELDDHNRVLTSMHNDEVKLWQEFDAPDPWRYMLWHCVDEKENLLRLKKTFIQRDLSKLSFSEVVLKNYSRQNAVNMLQEHGFGDIQVYEFWDTNGDLTDDEFIVTGQK
jgi:SAM-dependent methyltransferase